MSSASASLQWTKAAACGATYHCVLVAPDGDMIAIGDSKSPSDVLRYTIPEFAAFLDGVKKGEFDHLLIPRQRTESAPSLA
jgi:hypothetical protein